MFAEGSKYLFNFNGNTLNEVSSTEDFSFNLTYDSGSQFGSSAIFSGTSYVRTTENLLIGKGDFTIEGWVKTTNVPTDHQRILAPANTFNNIRTLQVLFKPTTNTIEYAPNGGKIASVVDAVNDGNWHHFAFTREGTTLRSFLDGVLKETISNYNTNLNHIDSYYIGRSFQYNSGTSFIGELDDIHVSTLCKYTATFTVPNSETTPSYKPINVLTSENNGFTLTFDRNNEEIFFVRPDPIHYVGLIEREISSVRLNLIKMHCFNFTTGGTEIGGITNITGTVKKKVNGVPQPYSRAFVRLLRHTDKFVFRQKISENGEFVLENLNPAFRYNVTLEDADSTQAQTLIEVYSPDTINFILEEDNAVVVNDHKVEGKVYDHSGQPVARKVCVFSKTTDEFLGSMISDETTGFYSIGFVSPDPVYVVCFPNDNEDINAKIYDRIVPVPV